MEQIGWSLVDGGGTELQFWGDTPGQCAGAPLFIRLPNGDAVHCPQAGQIQEWKLVPRVFQYASSQDIAWSGTDIVVSRTVTPEMVATERDRRLALGFNYNFGDARGIHRIGTKKSDIDGWAEVSTYAGALIDSGDMTTTIAIVTDTGPCLVTAPEWRAIELAAAAFRQPIWAKSFALMASNPIPADFTNDSYWT